jgi:hypothetical protein
MRTAAKCPPKLPISLWFLKKINAMWFYVLICFCLALVGVVGMQLLYMAYFDRMDKERRKYMRVLENRCRSLSGRLHAAEARVKEYETLHGPVTAETDTDEIWADVIDER